MCSNKVQDRLLTEAMETLGAIWNWDYRNWEHVSHLVTGPLAILLKGSMSDEDEDVDADRQLVELSISSCTIENDTASVVADYVWQKAEEAPVRERIVWGFVHQDGRWKAAALSR